MPTLRSILVATVPILALTAVATACPMCKETLADTGAAAAAGGADSGQNAPGLPAGFNYSIFVMLASVFGVAGFVIRTLVRAARTTPMAAPTVSRATP